MKLYKTSNLTERLLIYEQKLIDRYEIDKCKNEWHNGNKKILYLPVCQKWEKCHFYE